MYLYVLQKKIDSEWRTIFGHVDLNGVLENERTRCEDDDSFLTGFDLYHEPLVPHHRLPVTVVLPRALCLCLNQVRWKHTYIRIDVFVTF